MTDLAPRSIVTLNLWESLAGDGPVIEAGSALFAELKRRGLLAQEDFAPVATGRPSQRMWAYKGRVVWEAHELPAWAFQIGDRYHDPEAGLQSI